MEKIYCRTEDKRAISDVRAALTQGKTVELHNIHETFYGCGFDTWVSKELADLSPSIEVKGYDRFRQPVHHHP